MGHNVLNKSVAVAYLELNFEMEKLTRILPIFFLFIIFLMAPVSAEAATHIVRVLLQNGVTNCLLSGSNLSVSDGNGINKKYSGSLNIISSGNNLIINNEIYISPLRITSDSPIVYNSVKYNGEIVIVSLAGGTLKIKNEIDMEEYVKGVLGSEMPTSWNIEALKAQAVIARTYAMKSSAKHGDCDLCATTHCQLYKGVSAETPRITEAVDSTTGMYLSWQGTPAQVFYHADSGGMTASSVNVWGKNIEYLRSVVEPITYKNSTTVWEANLAMSLVSSRLNASGISVGEILSITPIKRDNSGRVMQLEVKGTSSTKTISGGRFRSAMGVDKVKSTLFEFSQPLSSGNQASAYTANTSDLKNVKESINVLPSNPQDKLVWMTKNKIFTTAELMQILSQPEKSDYYLKIGMDRMNGSQSSVTQTETNRALTPRSGSYPNVVQSMYNPSMLSNAPASGRSINIYGRGSGHGVGLSQWGCKTLAENGWDYRQILSYYFFGTTITQ